VKSKKQKTARVFLKSLNAFRASQCRQGFNLVNRVVRGDKPDDSKDLFEFLESATTKEVAQKRVKTLQKKSSFKVEIVEYKPKKD
jgi:hypothetical protein